MSLKINKIVNVKKLDLSTTSYDEKVGLIYGLNGAGKSTIKQMLVSLSKGGKLEPHFGNKNQKINVEIEMFGIPYIYSSGKWNKDLGTTKIEVFDTAHVHDNIYIDGSLSTSHKDQLSDIIIGADNIKQYREVVKIEGKVRENTEEIKKQLEDVAENEIFKTIKHLAHSLDEIDAICVGNKVVKFNIDSFPILKKHFKEKIKDTEQARKWLQEGIEHVKTDKFCPMCGQATNKEILELFKLFAEEIIINESYKEDINLLGYHIGNAKRILDTLRGEVSIGNVNNIKSVLNKILAQKVSEFSKPIFIRHNKTLDNLIKRLEKYNEQIQNIKAEKEKVAILESIKYFEKRKFKPFTSLKKHINADLKLKKIKEVKNLSIKDNIYSSLSTRLSFINEELAILGFPYYIDLSNTIEDLKAASTKQKNSARVGIKLKCRISHVNIAETKLKTTLSQGEKEALAWVLFKNNILQSSDKVSKLIILDDPIASFDEFKRFSVLKGINEILSKNCNTAILVLTHNQTMVATYSRKRKSIYRLKNKELVKVNFNELIKNEYEDNMAEIYRLNKIGISDKNIIEFIVRMRTLVEINRGLEQNLKRKDRLEKDFKNISAVLHLQSNKINKVTVNSIRTTLRKHDEKFKLNCSVDLQNLDLLKSAYLDLGNIYALRLILEDFLTSKMGPSVRHRVYNNKTITAGSLFEEASKRKLLSEKEIKMIDEVLPILNIIYHSGVIYGLSISDLEDWQLAKVSETIKLLIQP